MAFNKPARWTADQIRSVIRSGNVCVVTRDTNGIEPVYSNLGMRRAARLSGTYLVTEFSHETLVDLNSQRLESHGD